MTPCKPKLYEAFERAKAKAADGHVASLELIACYRTKVGKIMFASSGGGRPDLAYPVNVCSRVATYPTEEMEEQGLLVRLSDFADNSFVTHSRPLTLRKLVSTHPWREYSSPPRPSGESLPWAEGLQAVAIN